VVNWLFTKVQGFTEKREAKKYASQMLKTGFIKHTVNKVQLINGIGTLLTRALKSIVSDSHWLYADPTTDPHIAF
jgi:hypothetical protein